MTLPNTRKAQERQRRRDAGQVKLEFWVPADQAGNVKEAVKKMLDTQASENVP